MAETTLTAPVDAASRSGMRRDVVRTQIHERAAALFAERGFAATTLHDIAAAVGMTRPALYHYVTSKDALIADIAHDLVAAIGVDLASISDDDHVAPVLRLRRLIHRIVVERLERPHRYLLFVRAGRELPPAIATAYDEAQDLVVGRIARVLADGVVAGDFRGHDTPTSSHSVFAMANSVVWWAGTARTERREEIANEVAELAVASVRAAAPALRHDLVQDTIADLRRVVDRLQGAAANDNEQL